MSDGLKDQRSDQDANSGNTQKSDLNEFSNFEALDQLCAQNAAFFKDDQTEKGQRIYEAFKGLADHLGNAKELVKQMRTFVHLYDFDEETPGNGFRSFITVVEACISHSTELAKYMRNSCTKVFFRKGHYMKEIEACSHFLASICTILEYLLILRKWSQDGDLFCGGAYTVDELLQYGDPINQYCFYGRCLAIQYSPSIRTCLRFISVCMAGFSESYYSQSNRVARTTSSVWTGGKYFLNPEQRARRIVNISQYAEIDFCKAFWFLAEGEIMHALPSIVGNSAKVNKVISLPPEEIQLKNLKTDELVTIPVPSSHFGPGPVNVRLLSTVVREGMIGFNSKSRRIKPPSKCLIIHSHGGGFVAQSSKSHELYLRDWASDLDVPILSIDYSLAPQAPFPRALEEVFYTYCWAVKNSHCLGSTGEKIILAGDSAGANLSIGCTLKCIELGIRRPDGLFMAYCPVLIDFVPSPARMLCLMDPLLPFGFMMRCLRAYACPNDETIKQNFERAELFNRIKGARESITLHSFDHTASRKSSKATIISAGNGFLDANENGAITTSTSDNISDTFASASYQNHTVENTEVLTAEDASSCVSFEDDSQPITKMPDVDVNKSNGEAVHGNGAYVSEFLKNYIVEPGVEVKENGHETLLPSIPKTLSEENILTDACKDIFASDSIQSRLNKAAGGIVEAISTKLGEYTNSTEIAGSSHDREYVERMKNLDSLIARSPSSEFIFQVPKDPHMSPYWAKDDVLSQMPPTSVLSIDMDPCLDDCIMFAKKLKKLGVPVTMDILKGLPHGFLNFTKVSVAAMAGSKQCVKRLAQLLDINVT